MDTMKVINLLFKKMRQYDPKMLWMLAANAVSSALYPFIWVLVPAIILRWYQSWQLWQLTVLLAGAGILAMLLGFIVEWLQGNYRMRMDTVRYNLIHDLTEATLRMPYENTFKPDMLNRIFILDNGRLIAEGNHAELMSEKGLYAQMFSTQAEQYQTINNH